MGPTRRPDSTDTPGSETGPAGTRSPGERLRREESPAETAETTEIAETTETAEIAEIADRIAQVLPRWELVATYRLRDVALRHRLSVNELAVIAELLFRPKGLTGAQIANLVGLGSGGVTGILARLEERDLVERVPDPDDRRQLVALPTPEARELLWDDVVATDVGGLLRGMDGRSARNVALFVGRATDRGFRRSQAAHDRRSRQRPGVR